MQIFHSHKIIILFFIFFSTHIQAQTKKVLGPFNLFEKQVTIKFDSTTASYTLPDSFIIRNTEKIILQDSLLLPERDYHIDYLKGKVTFLKKYNFETECTISYQFLPFQLRTMYYHRKLTYVPDSMKQVAQPLSIVPSTKETPRQRSDLQKNGSIVRGISLGTNQGLKVESGLRMNISGKIADKVEVVAALTDQTTPIQPEGNTQTLNEIDKVYVQLKADHFDATMGDYYLSFSGSEFGQYQRKLQGAMGTADFDQFDFTVSGAVSKGQYTTNNFMGLEGNQGPYQLRGERGEIDIIVLAGTEKVWIDGELLTRGENNDYIIEYSIGQITFTRKRLITADSRIIVDFQYSDLQFRRNLYGMKSTANLWNDRLNLDVRMIHEADDKNNPLDFTLTDENLDRLKTAGDNPDSAQISGINYVGDKKGYYIKVDSLDIQFFRYVGADSGNYNVAFSYVGSGNGDYKSIGFGNYQYVGSGQGSYAPVIFLKPAQSHDLADVALKLKLRKDISITGEFATSRFDQNTYSSMDDADNSGIALVAGFNFQPEKLMLHHTNFGKLTINGKYRVVDSQFRYIDRNDEVEKSRKWDSGDISSVEEKISEFKANYQPVPNLGVNVGLGSISKGSTFNSNRWEAQTDIKFKKFPQLHYKVEVINSDNKQSLKVGDWLRQSGNADYRFWKLRPFFSYSGEHKREVFQDTTTLGFKYDEFTTGLALDNLKKMSTSVSVSTRDDNSYAENKLEPQSEALTYKTQWQYAGGSAFSASMDYTHRDKRYSTAGQSNTRTDLGDVKINYSPFKRALITNWNYQISNTQVAKKENVYLKVSQGEGNYRYNEQTGEYEPDDLGDYVLRIRQTDEFIPVVELRASSRIQFNPKLLFKKQNLKDWQKWLSTLSTDTYIRLEEKTEEKDVWAIYRLDLSKFQKPGTTIYGNNSLRQDIFYKENDRNFSVRLRFDVKEQVNYQFIDRGTTSDFDEKSLRIIKRFSDQFSSQIDGSTQSKYYRFTNRADKEIEINDLAVDLSYRPKQVLELALKSKVAYKKDIAIDPATKATEYSLEPRASYSFRGKGKIRLEFEWTKVNVTPGDRIVPYELVGLNRTGITARWLLALNYNISNHIRATVSYNGRREPDRPDIIHIARAEMRAYF